MLASILYCLLYTSLGRLQNAVIYRAVGVIDSLVPDDGKIIEAAIIPTEGSEAEVSAHDGAAAAGQGRQRAGEAVGHGAGAVHSQQLDIAAAVSDTVPTDDRLLSRLLMRMVLK